MVLDYLAQDGYPSPRGAAGSMAHISCPLQYIPVALALLASGCADMGEAPSRMLVLGECRAPDGPRVTVPFAFFGPIRCGDASAPNGTVVTTEEQWTPIRERLVACADTGVPLPGPVDFEREFVLIVNASAASSCGVEFVSGFVASAQGLIYAEIEVVDTSAGCPAQCSSLRGFVAAIRLPRQSVGTVDTCRRIRNGCT